MLSLAAIFLALAPVPQPRTLTAEMLVGRWDYSWGMMTDGWIEFYPDGRYFSRHSPEHEPTHTGRFTIDRDLLTLHEGRCPCLGSWDTAWICSRFEVRVSTRDYPVIVGKSGATDVKFSKSGRD